MIPAPISDSPAQRVRDEARTARLLESYLTTRAARAACEAAEIRALAAAAAFVDEQRDRLESPSSRAADLPGRTMVAELATASRVSERTAQRQLHDAGDLCRRFPQLVDALDEARIASAHVRVIHEAGFAIQDAAARAAFVATAIGRAETTTPGRLRPIVQVLAARAHDEKMQDRHDRAVAQRMVRVVDGCDGMADLRVTGAALLIHAAYDRLTADAHSVITARAATEECALMVDRGSGHPDDRTMDQLRSDILTDLLLTGTPQSCSAGDGIAAVRPRVQVTVPVLTAAAVGDEPALLAGYGPIDPATARQILAHAHTWERVLTSPLTGAIVAVDSYRPSEAMKRFLGARDERCRFPGCRQPVWRCDLDHTVDAALGGATSCSNLAHVCRRHHVLKHNSAWTVRQREVGELEWTSPTGRVYRDLAEPVVRFVAADEVEGFSARFPGSWPAPDPSDPPDF